MINCCLQEQETEFCSEILDTRVSILDELLSTQQTTVFSLQRNVQKKAVCHLQWIGLQGLADLLQDPQPGRAQHDRNVQTDNGAVRDVSHNFNEYTATVGILYRVRKVNPGMSLVCTFVCVCTFFSSALLNDKPIIIVVVVFVIIIIFVLQEKHCLSVRISTPYKIVQVIFDILLYTLAHFSSNIN